MSSELMLAKEYCILVFKSTHHAMAAEKAAIEGGLEHIIVPTPTAITASCGLAIKLREHDLDIAMELLNTKGIGTFQPYKINEQEIVRL
ncbi:MAG TPA: DUF3343 domain-containing protein [Bacillota bacterium]|nr:DUF3343 domain-containing protein [Bacillota bacterium]